MIVKNETKVLKTREHQQCGFTLLELLLYVSLASVTVIIFFSMHALVTQSREKSYHMVEINEQGLQVAQRITQVLRNAVSVDLPQGATDDEITVIDPDNGTIRFFIDSGQVWEQAGSDDPVALTDNKIETASLEFSNVSLPNAAASINIEFNLTTPEVIMNEAQYTQDFQVAASLREY